jgi:hypothetical protein
MIRDAASLFKTPPDASGLTDYLTKIFSGFRETNLFIGAFESGMFELLKDPKSPDELSSLLGTDPVITSMMCRALMSRDLLVLEDGRYRNSFVSDMFLTEDSEYGLTNRLRQDLTCLKPWGMFEEHFHNGPELVKYEDMFGDLWISAIGESRKLEGISKIVDAIAKEVDLDNIETVMEVGAGHAFHLIGLCHLNPSIKPYVFDKPEIIDRTVSNMNEYGFHVNAIAGDYYEVGVGGPFDLVIIMFNPAGSDVKLCENISSAVGENGYLFVRRHNTILKSEPFSDMDRALRTWPEMERGLPRSWGDVRNGSEGYDERMQELGLDPVFKEQFDSNSEIILFRRRGSCHSR